MSKSKKSTKIIEPTTTSELKESEMKSSKMSSSKTKRDKDESMKTSMIQSIHSNKTRDEGQIIDIWNSNLQDAMSKIEDIIEKYPYIALVCKYMIHCMHSSLHSIIDSFV